MWGRLCVPQTTLYPEEAAAHRCVEQPRAPWCRMSASHRVSSDLCFVVSAAHVSPGSEIGCVLAHRDSPALLPVKKKGTCLVHFNTAPAAPCAFISHSKMSSAAVSTLSPDHSHGLEICSVFMSLRSGCDHNSFLLEVEVKCSSYDEKHASPAGKVKICFPLYMTDRQR